MENIGQQASYVVLWLLLVAMCSILLFVLKEMNRLKRELQIQWTAFMANDTISKSPVVLFGSSDIWLFIDHKHPHNDIHIQKARQACKGHRMLIVLIGPQWKANALQKKLQDQTIWVDEKGKLAQLFRVTHFPQAITIGNDFRYQSLKWTEEGMSDEGSTAGVR
ncbi:hypothetical protein ACFPVX_02705 [Cohnella faecalis]|uniref:Uncharacterized protein n=1 Tax=Cohnella faecalis TaxID=2315694 RepID=A0A398CZE5_9BACL|nr:hypothetical protein [Cohnella faecalis]RIE05227.1 hypothetical protein D3H35_01520 [Cohnella faecalis]